MAFSQAASLQNLATLNAQEEAICNKLISILNEGDKGRMTILLPTYPLRLIYALSEKSPQLNKLFLENERLNNCWSGMLQQLGYPFHEIISFDRKATVPLFSQLKGAFLLSEYDKHANKTAPVATSILNKACDLGMYQAHILRMNLYSNVIAQNHHSKNSQEMIDTYIQLLIKDVQNLSNLYWSMGCIDSALILFKVMNYYFEQPEQRSSMDRFFSSSHQGKFAWKEKYDDKNCPFPVSILEVAVENVYLARLLMVLPQSHTIAAQLTQGKGEFAELEDKFKTYADLQDLVIQKMQGMKIPSVELFCQNAFNHAVATIKKKYPEFDLPDELALSGVKELELPRI